MTPCSCGWMVFPENTIYLEDDGTFEEGKTASNVNIDPYPNTTVIFLDGAQAARTTPDHYAFPLPKG